jgi:hypothetical protein
VLPKYEDILALAERAGAGEPLWADENGVPRFAKFHPDLLGVYDRYAVLAGNCSVGSARGARDHPPLNARGRSCLLCGWC